MKKPELFSIATHHGEGDVRVSVSGEVDMAAEEPVVLALANALQAANGSSLILDLTAVTFMDSSGLRAVLRAQRAAASHGARFAVAATPGGPVERLFFVAGVADRLRCE